jgi:6-pyruvoyltetrahydropterin/6-carboxytetrahydropterin synthase
MDFGGLKAFKDWSEYMFDHTLVIAKDDPHLPMFLKMAELGLQDQGGVCDIRLVEAVGCEKFAELAYNVMADILNTYQTGGEWNHIGLNKTYAARYPVEQRVRLRSAEVFEHDGNSAIYEG